MLLKTVENGVIKTPEQFKAICVRMLSSDWKFCPGIDMDDYEECREAIRYDIKTVQVTKSPISRVDSVKCKLWFQIAKNSLKEEKEAEAVMCTHCKQIRREMQYALNRVSKVTESQKAKRTQPSSSYPLKYLSPTSQHLRRMNTQYERSHDKRLLRKYAPPDVILDDEQHQEMAMAVQKIEELANSELQQLFQEAGVHGAGNDIQRAWEEDKNKIQIQFNSDQQRTGIYVLLLYHVHTYHTYMLHNVVTGKRGNRWSPITIRIGKGITKLVLKCVLTCIRTW